MSYSSEGVWGRSSAIVSRGIAAVADFLIPPACLACHRPLSSHDAICSGCWAQIDFIRPPLCDRLGIPLPFDIGGPMISAAAAADPPDYDRARAVARFDGILRQLVHDLKFRDRHDARRLFGRWLAETGRDLLTDADIVLPVPLTRSRLLSRRFNQSAILAHEVARLAAIRYEPEALRRTRRTPPQVGLTRQQRRDNVSGAFAVSHGWASRVAGARLVLVDDVITTGATVGACARALKKAGAIRVDVLALGMVTDPAFLSP
jgi:ComF family protein